MSRRTKKTRARDKRFFEALESSPLVSVSKAAKAAGYSRPSVYEYKKKDPDFAARFNGIMDERIEELESAAYEMAYIGEVDYKTVIDPKTKKKKTVPVRKRHAGILMFLLGAGNPEKYRTNYKTAGTESSEIEELTDEELAALDAELDADISRYEVM